MLLPEGCRSASRGADFIGRSSGSVPSDSRCVRVFLQIWRPRCFERCELVGCGKALRQSKHIHSTINKYLGLLINNQFESRKALLNSLNSQSTTNNYLCLLTNNQFESRKALLSNVGGAQCQSSVLRHVSEPYSRRKLSGTCC